jgi:uncharacterized protein DUF3182
MSKERVFTNLDGTTSQEPYCQYYCQRNGRVSEFIADSLGIPLAVGGHEGDGLYHVMARTVTKVVAKKLGILKPSDFYGGAVDHLQQTEKSVLHPGVEGYHPRYFSPEFARLVKDSVLPGFSVFGKENALEGFEKLKRMGGVRLKLLPNSDGHGQFKVSSMGGLKRVLAKIDEAQLAEFGAVLEPDLFEAETVSVGEIVIGGGDYSFLAFQKDDIDPGDRRNRYMGADLITVRGPMTELLKLDQARSAAIQVRQAIAFHGAYSYFNPVLSRVSYDVLSGVDSNGEAHSGVTDITARLGGSCPAVMLGVRALDNDPKIQAVRAEVDLDYEPREIEPGSEIFINHSTLTITAKVTETQKGGR